MHIGLLMVNEENDILERTLSLNASNVDVFYAVDGTTTNSRVSREIITSHPLCGGYWTDTDVKIDPRFPGKPCDGYRQFLLERAYADHGHDHWFLLLHGDEVWTQDVWSFTRRMGFAATGFVYQLPFFVPRAGEDWDDDIHPLEQLHWYLGPGWPELRLFRGGPDVQYNPQQHFNVTPSGIRAFAAASDPILHYPYRAPDVQRTRAQAGFDPDNYRHVADHDSVYWTDDMIAERLTTQFYSHVASSRSSLKAVAA